MKPFYLIWNEKSRPQTIKHFSEGAAEREVERLACVNPGEKFHVLKLIGTCEVKNPVIWERPDDIPF